MAPETAQPLPNDPLWNQVAGRIRAEILSGERVAGTRLLEATLAKQLVVSQATVRTALASLAHAGLVTQVPRRGSYVAEISVGDAKDVYEVRQQLKTMAVATICTRLDSVARDALVCELGLHLDGMLKAAAAPDQDALIESEASFHRCVWEASGNSMLRRVWPIVEASHRNLTKITNLVCYGDLHAIAQTHEPLIQALEAGDQASAVQLFSEHIHEVWQRLEAAAPGGDAPH